MRRRSDLQSEVAARNRKQRARGRELHERASWHQDVARLVAVRKMASARERIRRQAALSRRRARSARAKARRSGERARGQAATARDRGRRASQIARRRAERVRRYP
jgi:hypothetical protein